MQQPDFLLASVVGQVVVGVAAVPQHLAVKRGAQGITARSGSSGSEQLGVTWQKWVAVSEYECPRTPGALLSQLLSTAEMHYIQ